ncbi:Transcription factor, enhancer of yellow 2 [Carpediemonas membranifera]|uniref:Transcription and mRNA export factor ENY2 n=1 Tax=Carpediemonas membranifera TaxID=201153 RepID=A0A8J6EBA9_9EUKA|nr:Transcription factor, enhancer of yellow 2 [Carpediemonas membranifera]|eukprot:KAG9396715.1 Transcription factor, enhancer of yellow 2 [Carpediemonas membranifera]
MAEEEQQPQGPQNNLRSAIAEKLENSNERQVLQDLLDARLTECGWRDELKKLCDNYITERGIESIALEDMVNDILPVAISSLPDSVKAEVLQRLRSFVSSQ